MKLQLFNGGKNSRLAPHLIGINEGIVYTNIDGDSGSLTPFKQKRSLGTLLTQYSHYFTTINDWVTSSNERSYVEYRNILYFTETGVAPQKTSDGTTLYQLGIINPILAATVAIGAAGVLTGTYQYLVTFYNSTEGVESGPSPLSSEVTVSSDQVDLTAIEVSSDPQVDQKRIYRLGGNLTSFTLVATINNVDVTYTDNIADTAVEGTILESTFYQPAPAGLQFLIEHYGIFIGAVGDKVYFTPIGRPNAWPTLNFIDFDSNVVGIGKVYNGIVVCTALKSYVITGTNTNSFVKNTLSSFQGCKKHHSMRQVSNGELLWVSNDGICSSKGSQINVISRHKLGKLDLSVKNAVVHDETYYLQKIDGTILSVDMRYGTPIFRDLAPDTENLVVANDILYGIKDNILYQMFDSTSYETFTWLSPVIIEGAYTELKKYKSIFIRSEGSLTFKVYLDGVLRLTKSLTGTSTHEIKVPQEFQDAYSVQFEISGTGIVREIEFKPLGRKSD